jgi:hypothetical protein
MGRFRWFGIAGAAALSILLLSLRGGPDAAFLATDPGVRGGSADAGGPLAGLTGRELDLFAAGKDDFEEVESVEEGLGPRFNLNSCVGCHRQPEVGGTSPLPNPQEGVSTSLS